MGLIKAIQGAAGGVLADQWKEFFYCDSLPREILMKKGQKRTSARSSNTKGEDNIISNGSGIAVADGQCMIIVEQGKVVEVCAEPGEFTYDSSTEPSIFAGSLGKSILDTFKAIGKRFTYGGDTGKDQRIYYFNTKEIIDNKFGTATPIPFRVVDTKIGLDLDVSLRCNGVYTFRICNPLLFYTNVCGNVADEYRLETIQGQLKIDFIDALQPSVGKLSSLEIRPYEIPNHTMELREAVNTYLDKTWGEVRGLEVVTISMNSPSIPEDDQKRLKDAQMYSNPTMAAAALVGAQAEAMKTAAGNAGGAMTGFMGMGMAAGAGGMNPQNLYAMGQQQAQAQQAQQAQQVQQAASNAWTCACGAHPTGNFCPQCGSKKPEPKSAENGWKCACGATVTGKFCTECGAKKPEDTGAWTCTCGKVNTGKFCSECGGKKPEAPKSFRCNKCGWTPENPAEPPKFCPECGDVFDSSDAE